MLSRGDRLGGGDGLSCLSLAREVACRHLRAVQFYAWPHALMPLAGEPISSFFIIPGTL